MKKMKLLAAVLAIMMSFAFAACTSQTSETPSGHVHEWGEWTETKAPSYTEPGEETIAVTVNDLPKINTGLEIISFEHGIDDLAMNILIIQ